MGFGIDLVFQIYSGLNNFWVHRILQKVCKFSAWAMHCHSSLDNPTSFENKMYNGNISIFQPYNYLHENDIGVFILTLDEWYIEPVLEVTVVLLMLSLHYSTYCSLGYVLVILNYLFWNLYKGYILSNSSEVALSWIPQNLTNYMSTLVLVLVWCHRVTSHYLH